MAIYRIYWKKSAQKELKRVDRQAIPRIIAAVEQLAHLPYTSGCTKYQGTEHAFRIRTGSYRIVYTVFDNALTIEVIKVGHRKDVYKKL